MVCLISRLNFLDEIAALASFAKHLHLHDSLGRQDDSWMFTKGERLAYGHGDLHLPVGWGDIPWADIFATSIFPKGAVFNNELQMRHWYEAAKCVDTVKGMAKSAKTTLPPWRRNESCAYQTGSRVRYVFVMRL